MILQYLVIHILGVDYLCLCCCLVSGRCAGHEVKKRWC